MFVIEREILRHDNVAKSLFSVSHPVKIAQAGPPVRRNSAFIQKGHSSIAGSPYAFCAASTTSRLVSQFFHHLAQNISIPWQSVFCQHACERPSLPSIRYPGRAHPSAKKRHGTFKNIIRWNRIRHERYGRGNCPFERVLFSRWAAV